MAAAAAAMPGDQRWFAALQLHDSSSSSKSRQCCIPSLKTARHAQPDRKLHILAKWALGSLLSSNLSSNCWRALQWLVAKWSDLAQCNAVHKALVSCIEALYKQCFQANMLHNSVSRSHGMCRQPQLTICIKAQAVIVNRTILWDQIWYGDALWTYLLPRVTHAACTVQLQHRVGSARSKICTRAITKDKKHPCRLTLLA